MYELKIISQFAAAHQLRALVGGCENLHGHNWKVEVTVIGNTLGDDGLLMDFRVIKEHTKEIIDDLDHKYLNEIGAFKSMEPSSENIAHHIFKTLSDRLEVDGVRVSKVTAWESESACASYMEP
ncbi:MAG: 6-carboxytetrahydropterin synthase QueD [Desulfobacteraceae bacterium 4572_87]|nr:MAG: 6-carboxytetrahydropterin synthase QueD [Desulfobacteraceae bacterium 4572_87]